MTPWTVALQAPLFPGLSWQGSRSGLPFPPSEDTPNPGIEPMSSAVPALAGGLFTAEPPGRPAYLCVRTWKATGRGVAKSWT